MPAPPSGGSSLTTDRANAARSSGGVSSSRWIVERDREQLRHSRYLMSRPERVRLARDRGEARRDHELGPVDLLVFQAMGCSHPIASVPSV
jgi:hypothetical protein